MSHIKKINEIVLDKLNANRGLFKEHQNYIIGASFNTATPQETPYLMQQLIDNTRYRLDHSEDTLSKVESILDMHIQFERIHPFADGNGRTGRLLINQLLYNENLPFLIIEKKDEAEYLQYLDKQDLKGFVNFALPKMRQEKERLISFNLNHEKYEKKNNPY